MEIVEHWDYQLQRTYRPYVGTEWNVAEIRRRMEYLPFEVATFLSPGNILNALSFSEGYEKAKQFFAQDFLTQRDALVGIVGMLAPFSKAALDAIREVPRHQMVPQERRVLSYWNSVNWVSGLTALTPAWLAGYAGQEMIVYGARNVLVLGFGTGYLTAVLSRMLKQSGTVTVIEISEENVFDGKKRFADLGYLNVRFVIGDAINLPEDIGRFDAIWPTLSVRQIPASWWAHLLDHGRLAAFLPLDEKEFDFGALRAWWWPAQQGDYGLYLQGEWWKCLKLVILEKAAERTMVADVMYDLFNPPMADATIGAPPLSYVLGDPQWEHAVAETERRIVSALLR